MFGGFGFAFSHGETRSNGGLSVRLEAEAPRQTKADQPVCCCWFVAGLGVGRASVVGVDAAESYQTSMPGRRKWK